MLVDNAIVIIENIYKFLEEGNSLVDAAKLGAGEVAWPVFTSTMTTIAAFFPLLFWSGVIGEFMRFIPLVLITTLLSSLFVALVINPVFASVFMKLENPDDEPQSILEKILHPLNKITHYFVDDLLPTILNKYEKILLIALGPARSAHQKVNKRNIIALVLILPFFIVIIVLGAILPGLLLVVVCSLLGIGIIYLFTNNKLRVLWGTMLLLFTITLLYGNLGHGLELFPKTQPKRIIVSVNAPSGTSLDMSDKIVNEIERKLKDLNSNDVKDIVAVVGVSSNKFDGGTSTPNKSTITIQFIDFEEREQSSLLTTEEIRDDIVQVAGADVIVKQEEMGPPVGSAINIELRGDDYKILGELSEQIKTIIKNIPGVVDLKDDYDVGKPEIRVEVDREKAALYSMNTGMIANAIRTAINGTTASKYRVGEDEYDITVRLKKDQRSSINALENLKIIYNNKKGKTLNVPLISVAKILKSKGPGSIRRKDLKRVITISANAKEKFNANDVLNSVKAELNNFKLPPGYLIEYTGQDKEQKKASAFLSKAFWASCKAFFIK